MNDRKEINEIKEGLKSLLDRLETLEKVNCTPREPLKKPFKVKLPEDGTVFYCVYGDRSSIFSLKFNKNDADDVALYLNNMLVKTKEEAEQRLKEQRLLFKIKKWAEIHNEGWEPDWSDYGEFKYYIKSYVEDEELWINSSCRCSSFTKLPYFKTLEITQACIDEFGKEIKEVLC